MSLHVWFKPLIGPGEECVDLATCRRFVCWEMGPDSDHELIFYETPDPRWIKCHRFEAGDDFYQSCEEVRGPEVAYELLHVPRFKGRLTPALEQYRELGDLERFREWMSGIREKYGNDDGPRWDREAGVFYIGDSPVRNVASQARNQRMILNALEKAGWPSHPVRIGLDDSQLSESVGDMNIWLSSTHFRVAKEQKMVRWVRKG